MSSIRKSVKTSPAALVAEAIDRFSTGDDEGFVAWFDPDATIWSEPQLATAVALRGRAEIAAWCREAHARWSDVRFAHGELSDQGAGAYVELDVITANDEGGGAWRLPIAAFVRDGLVLEVVPHADRDAAVSALSSR